MNAPHGRDGVTLVELVLACALASLALVALAYLTSMAARQHVDALRNSSAQFNAALALKLIEREMSVATYLLSPQLGGVTSDVLTACANAAPSAAGGAPVPIDDTRPMRFIAFCQAGGVFYHHTGEGCPAAYVCGTAAETVVGGAERPVSASFLRAASGGRVVEASVRAVRGDVVVTREGTFAMAVAEGMNP